MSGGFHVEVKFRVDRMKKPSDRSRRPSETRHQRMREKREGPEIKKEGILFHRAGRERKEGKKLSKKNHLRGKGEKGDRGCKKEVRNRMAYSNRGGEKPKTRRK